MTTGALSDRRYWLSGGALVAVVISAVAWFFIISPELDSAQSYRDQSASTRLGNVALQAKMTKLAKARDNINQLQSDLRSSLAGLPPDSGLPALTKEIGNAAAAASVRLTSISVGGVTPVNAGTTNGTPSTDTTSPVTGVPSPGPSVPSAVAGQTFQISLTIGSSGPVAGQIRFLKALEDGPRRLLITNSQAGQNAVGTRPTTLDQSSTFTTTAIAFAVPMTTAQLAGLNSLMSTPGN